MLTSSQRRQLVRNRHRQRLAGFTLVELLVVISIIGLLVGLTVPAVMIALRTVKQRALALECQAIANSIEAYRNKFDEYPPDGADLALLTRHLRKAFPNIAPTEIALITGAFPLPSGNPLVAASANTGAVMDPTEALVFFLGGYSDDPVFPLSGKDGPILILDNSSPPQQVKSSHAPASISSIQYNPDRKNSFYDFKQGQLTLNVVGGLTISSDDGINGGVADILPAYHPPGVLMPYVYFDSRTYQQTTIANRFATTANGIVYPYRSTTVNTKYPPSDTSIVSRNKYFRFVNEKTFQLISAGLDDSYGGVSGLFYMYKPTSDTSVTGAASGDSLDLLAAVSGTHPTPLYTRFKDDMGTTQGDNVANFAEGLLEDSLGN